MWGKLLAVVLLLLLVGCQKPPPEYESRYTQPPPEPVGIPIAVVGDSYTSGTPVGGMGNKGWPALAEAQLRKQGIDVAMTVGAEGGSGYVDAGKNGNVFGDQVPRVVKPQDRLVVMFGSSNDGRGVPVGELQSAVQRTLGEVKRIAPEAKLLVIGPMFTRPNPSPQMFAARDIVRAQAEAVGATWVDPIAEGWFLDRQDLLAPDSHPTDAGHVYLADKMAPLIAQQLQAAPTGS